MTDSYDNQMEEMKVASTESTVRELIEGNLAVDGEPLSGDLDLDSSLSDHGVSSLDMVAFAEVVAREFGVTFTIEDCARLNSIRSLIEFLDN